MAYNTQTNLGIETNQMEAFNELLEGQEHSEAEMRKNGPIVSDNSDSGNFSTSQLDTNYKDFEDQFGNHAENISSSDDINPKTMHRLPVKDPLQTSSSSDDDDEPTKKPKIKKIDDSASQARSRVGARSIAPSKSSTRSTKSSKSSKSSKSYKSRKWTPEVVNEDPLQMQLDHLEELESRVLAETKKKKKDIQDYENDSKYGDKKKKKDNQDPDGNDSKYSDKKKKDNQDFENVSKYSDKISTKDIQDLERNSIQTKAEKAYAKMFGKRFPHLVQKKSELQEKRNMHHNFEINKKIIEMSNWSREQIAEENHRIQLEINEISKKLDEIRLENDELREKIEGYDDEYYNY